MMVRSSMVVRRFTVGQCQSRGSAMQVRELMSDRVIHVTPDTDLQAIAAYMRDGDLGSVPVSDDDKLIGMVTDRDIVIRGIAGTLEVRSLTARDVMSSGVKYCFEDESV